MGRQFNVSCKYCYYRSSADTGSTRSTVSELDLFPAICNNCEEIISVNLYHKPISCTKCNSENVIQIGDKTSRNAGKILTWEDLELQANELEKEFEYDKPNRYESTKKRIISIINIARIKNELVIVFKIIRSKLKNRENYDALIKIIKYSPEKFSCINLDSDKPITWEPVLPKLIKKFDIKCLINLYNAWKQGYIVWNEMHDILNKSFHTVIFNDFESAILKLGLSIVHDTENINYLKKPIRLEKLIISEIDYSNATLTDQEILQALDKIEQRTYWQSIFKTDRKTWIEDRVGIKPDWYEELHECPKCQKYGLKFVTSRFVD